MKVSDAVQLGQANIIHPLGIQEPAIIQKTSKDSAASWYTGPNRNVTTILLQFSKPPHCVCSIKQDSIPTTAFGERNRKNKLTFKGVAQAKDDLKMKGN